MSYSWNYYWTNSFEVYAATNKSDFKSLMILMIQKYIYLTYASLDFDWIKRDALWCKQHEWKTVTVAQVESHLKVNWNRIFVVAFFKVCNAIRNGWVLLLVKLNFNQHIKHHMKCIDCTLLLRFWDFFLRTSSTVGSF